MWPLRSRRCSRRPAIRGWPAWHPSPPPSASRSGSGHRWMSGCSRIFASCCGSGQHGTRISDPSRSRQTSDRPRPGTNGAPHRSSRGGVDSFFTALRHANGEGTPRTEEIDDLIFIHGYDIPLENGAAYSATLPVLERAAEELDRRLVVTATNLRATRFGATDWCRLSHGAALAAVGLALEPAYATCLIPSSAGYRDLRFWGSHPLTDPLFSTSTTRVVHDGPAFMRAEKTEYISTSNIALRALRVCWRSASSLNCNACNNCYRTMLTLEALGALGRCSTFDSGALDLRRAERIYCPHSYDIRQYGYVRDLAERNGRADIVRAVDRSLTGSARLKKRVDFLRGMRDRRILWRWAKPLEDRLLREWLV